MSRVPVIDIRSCSDCGTCLELCPAVFTRNDVSGLIEVRELAAYPEDEVQGVINCCPRDSVSWDD